MCFWSTTDTKYSTTIKTVVKKKATLGKNEEKIIFIMEMMVCCSYCSSPKRCGLV